MKVSCTSLYVYIDVRWLVCVLMTLHVNTDISIACSIGYVYLYVYHNYKVVVEFGTLTAVTVKSDIIWNVHGITSQKIVVLCFINWLLSLCVRVTRSAYYNLLYNVMFCNISHCFILCNDISLYVMRYVMLRCHFISCYIMLLHFMLFYVTYRVVSCRFCYVMLCCVVLCCAVLCYAMLCYVMLCYVMLCYVMLCYLSYCYKTCH
jgi:hypothetical protein